ncbi:MAG: hypothetical protein ABI083_06065 [Lapillicoccus sp.]
MFQVNRPPAATSTTRIVLALATAAALIAGPVASATARPVPEPSITSAISATSATSANAAGWQELMTELVTEARSTTSLAGRRMLHNELTIVMHSHHDW